MPSELRQVRFSPDEIITALVILTGETGFLPRGRITNLTVMQDGEAISARVSIMSKSGLKKIEKEVSAETLAAALIRLCQAEGIPLARTAQKSLARWSDGLAFNLALHGPQSKLSSALSLEAIEANARAAF